MLGHQLIEGTYFAQCSITLTDYTYVLKVNLVVLTVGPPKQASYYATFPEFSSYPIFEIVT